jgi:hypothetical protein
VSVCRELESGSAAEGTMQAWSQFYATIGAASAALLGLLFVAVSINASAALGPDQVASSRLTEQAFQNYLAVMLVSLVALFPGISTTKFGLITLITTASSSIWVVIRLYQTIRQRHQRSYRYVRRHITSLIGFGMLLASALGMWLKRAELLSWLAAATLVLLFSATAVSWELLKRLANR